MSFKLLLNCQSQCHRNFKSAQTQRMEGLAFPIVAALVGNMCRGVVLGAPLPWYVLLPRSSDNSSRDSTFHSRRRGATGSPQSKMWGLKYFQGRKILVSTLCEKYQNLSMKYQVLSKNVNYTKFSIKVQLRTLKYSK